MPVSLHLSAAIAAAALIASNAPAQDAAQDTGAQPAPTPPSTTAPEPIPEPASGGPDSAAADSSITAEQALENARAVYGPEDSRAACPQSATSEIVVCAPEIDNDEFRVKSASELDPDGLGSDDGLPRAPDVHGIPDIGGVTITGCFLPPCPPPPAYIIDFDDIPEPPEGSDADRISKGELRVD